MATAGPDNLYLSHDQQELLLRALTSNSSSSPMFTTPGLSHKLAESMRPGQKQLQNGGSPSHNRSSSLSHNSPASNSSHQSPPASAATFSDFPQGTPLMGPDVDYGDWDGEFEIGGDWDYGFSPDFNDPMDGSGLNSADDLLEDASPGNEKRKERSSDDGKDDPEPKRRESSNGSDSTSGVKQPKKPGRKPLTSEPTSKRKAQNRAAQRAFRERKEKHLRDLEQKVEDLEKASESTNQENSMLKAQVDRLQTELRDYRRRLESAQTRANVQVGNNGGFQFDFPPFGGQSILLRGQRNSTDMGLGGPDVLSKVEALTGETKKDGRSPSGSGKSFMAQLNDASLTTTPGLNGGDMGSSPSASSVSQHGPGSSCGTSPEPCTSSPKAMHETHVSANGDMYVCKSGSIDGETESTFCEKLGMACGNPNNPIPKAITTPPPSTGMDWFAQTSSATFDPVLFGDYRDPVNEVTEGLVGAGSSSFFDEAFPGVASFDSIGSPAAAPPAEPKKDLMAEIEKIQNADPTEEDDDDLVVPADDPKQMLSCNKIWDRISNHPRFVSGELDMDGLCSELRSKAKCSEVGVVVAENDVQEVLHKVGINHKDL